jgi:hypothetical protein
MYRLLLSRVCISMYIYTHYNSREDIHIYFFVKQRKKLKSKIDPI